MPLVCTWCSWKALAGATGSWWTQGMVRGAAQSAAKSSMGGIRCQTAVWSSMMFVWLVMMLICMAEPQVRFPSICTTSKDLSGGEE